MINWDEIRAKRPKNAPKFTINQDYDDEVKYVSYTFDPKLHKTIELMMLTDLQAGSKQFQEERFNEYVEWMLIKPNRYAFIGGDVIDAATKHSIGDTYENTMSPIHQVEYAVGLLRPLRDKNRLLGMVGGNHERRTIPTFGDAGRLIASALKVPYSKGVQLIDINYGLHKPFKVSLWHGSGNGKTKGGKAQMVHKFMGQYDSQLYLVGHLHDCLQIWDWRMIRKDGQIKKQKVCGIMSSSFQDFWGSYAEVYAMSPSDTMMARVILEPDGKWETTLR